MIYNQPTIPGISLPHRNAAVPPVTRDDLGADFQGYMQLIFCDWRTSCMYDAVLRLNLATVIMFRWYGSVEIEEAAKDPGLAGQMIPGWEEAARQMAAKGFFIYFNSKVASKISKEAFEKIKAIFGRRFLGFNEGEWDGAYISRIASGEIPLSPNRSRQEAHYHYMDWMKQAYDDHHHYMLTMTSIGMGCHYGAELGSRMMGAELSQCLPCNMILLAFCRGAAKQYDLLFHTVPSVFSSRGAPHTGGLKCYPGSGQPESISLPGLAGPRHGASLGLLKRLWWISHMSGSSITGFESGYFPYDGIGEYEAQSAKELPNPFTNGDIFAHLTPLGWMYWEALQTSRRHPRRGVPYIPIAVMLPVHHGWSPPEAYSTTSNCVWGNIPYEAGDWQIDKFFEWIYPGYKSAHAVPCCDERGIITNTPYGDSFDVILSTATDECLSKYQAVFLIGSVNVMMDAELQGRLERFIAAGGTIVFDSAQWMTKASDSPARDAVATHSVHRNGGRLVHVIPESWGAGDPDNSCFSSVTKALADFVMSFNLITIEGRPLYHLVSVTNSPDELIITLCNNSHALSWEGLIRVKGQSIIEFEEWLADGEATVCDGALRCGVPANDVRVFCIRTQGPFLHLQSENKSGNASE